MASSSPSPSPSTYLVVGAGCFGASTARALKRTHPDAEVVLADPAPPPDERAAAHDFNKIVRAEYDDPLYMGLALEALAAWSPDAGSQPDSADVVAPFFRRTGALWSITRERTRALVANYEAFLGAGNAPLEALSLDDARRRFPALEACQFPGGGAEPWGGSPEQCVLSPRAGWADAQGALGAVIQEAERAGVRYEVATVAKLTFAFGSGSGGDVDAGDGKAARCTGAVTTDGRRLAAKNVVLCAGAYVPWLLADSAPDRPALHAGDRMRAAAVLMALFRVPPGPEGLAKFEGAPVIVHPFGEYPSESIPPGSPHGPELAKCTHEFPYTHNRYHEGARQEISVPPLTTNPALMMWTRDLLPDALRANSAAVRDLLFGDAVQGMTPEAYRLCWDLSTPDEEWIISPHPAAGSLYVATGGSFHAFKFLPIIGKYVVQMIEGTLPEEYARRWAWDRKITPIRTPYMPRGDLSDVPGYPE
ncbi:sarcosine oxidase [Durotheca rogersii]|uniref:sarcosine oxidase n=1 Tax=Durotheca rogersii TaxID=419775 RepID=UPI00221ED2DB|nr:sarcosine oxidase [Durotheca rogersii]KAI5866133.1 sarcosine oxidase [Durotheca rogersii]